MPKIVDHDERRLALADAVLALIAREGISAVTTRAVAEESGWSTGVLNHYFGSRHELLLAALRRAGDIQATGTARFSTRRAPARSRSYGTSPPASCRSTNADWR